MVIFGHRRGGGPTSQKSRNYLFLGKIFKFQGGSGPPVPPSGSAHGFGTSVFFIADTEAVPCNSTGQQTATEYLNLTHISFCHKLTLVGNKLYVQYR